MARPELIDDIKTVIAEIKEELQKVFRFYRAQSAEASAKRKADWRVKLLEIGPIGWLKFVGALVVSLVIITAFSLAHVHWGWLIIIGILLTAADIAFAWGYILPFLKEVWEVIRITVVDVVGYGLKDFIMFWKSGNDVPKGK